MIFTDAEGVVHTRIERRAVKPEKPTPISPLYNLGDLDKNKLTWIPLCYQ